MDSEQEPEVTPEPAPAPPARGRRARMRFSMATTMMMVVAAAAASALFAKVHQHVPASNQPYLRIDAPVLFVLSIGLTAVGPGGAQGAHARPDDAPGDDRLPQLHVTLIGLAEAGWERPLLYWFQVSFALLVTAPLVARQFVKAEMERGPAAEMVEEHLRGDLLRVPDGHGWSCSGSCSSGPRGPAHPRSASSRDPPGRDRRGGIRAEPRPDGDDGGGRRGARGLARRRLGRPPPDRLPRRGPARQALGGRLEAGLQGEAGARPPRRRHPGRRLPPPLGRTPGPPDLRRLCSGLWARGRSAMSSSSAWLDGADPGYPPLQVAIPGRS